MLTLLRLHLCDFLEPVPPHLTVTWLVGLAKALPTRREGDTQKTEYNKIQCAETKPKGQWEFFPRTRKSRKEVEIKQITR